MRLFCGLLLSIIATISGAWRSGLSCGVDVYFATGDSITFGSNAGGVNIDGPSYVNYASIQPTFKYNSAVPGTGIGNAPQGTIDTYVSSRCNSANVVASALFGYNDYVVGHTATFAGDYSTIWAAGRRAAGVKVICVTLLPATTVAQPGYNAWRNNTNTTMRTWAPGGGGTQYCDGLADFGADPTMGPDTAPNDATLYVDKLHPSALGQQILAPVIQTVLRTLLH